MGKNWVWERGGVGEFGGGVLEGLGKNWGKIGRFGEEICEFGGKLGKVWVKSG